ncbi:hypothetical protein [Zavarzinella formosa]|uniref:hypothetical protein n=1 Tax=Zavarzinella formosa TaxID=360055 RepID=UPI0003652264|nr:hypothetical protein [Zavarzinella formosa]
MRIHRCVLAALLLLPAAVSAKDPCVSGPQNGQKPGPYSFLVASGPQRGQPTCYVCETAEKPGMIVFARSASPMLGKLLQQADQATADRPKGELTAWMTILGEKTLSIDELGKWAKEQGLKNVPTGVFDDPVGPPSYKLSPDADVTVILFQNRKVTGNYAYFKGELDDNAVRQITDAIKALGKK